MLSSVPAYRASVLPAPARLKVDLSIDFTDYSNEGALFSDSVAYGAFKVDRPDGDIISVYFQLNDDVSVTAAESGSVLSLTLTPREGAGRTAYFVGLDAFTEYEQGLVPDELGLTPTMCEGRTDVILISQAESTIETAEVKAEEISQRLGDSVERQAYAFEMNTAGLPAVVRRETAQRPDFQTVIAGPDDEPYQLPVLLEDGIYLCAAPDGTIFYARPFLPDSSQETELVLKNELWTMDAAGGRRKLDIRDFYDVVQASVSPSGVYLGVLESGLANRVMYVYNLETGDLQNLGEEGFGDITTSFVWDERDDIIYAMTGSGVLQLTKYDYSLPEQERVSSVEEMNGAESRLALAGYDLYFADQQSGPRGQIYCVDVRTARRSAVTQGIELALSPDGRRLVSRLPEDSVSVSLQFRDISTGAEKIIANNLIVENYAFGADSDILYYTTQTYEGIRGEYPFAFIKYNVSTEESEFLGYSKTGTFVPGTTAGEIYIIDYFERENHNFPVTYLYAESQ
jgi:hypothetical protein